MFKQRLKPTSMCEEMEMPTPCVKCKRIFELNDGIASEKWYPNTIICQTCGREEQAEIEIDEEIELLKEQLEEAYFTIKQATQRFYELKVSLSLFKGMPTTVGELKKIIEQYPSDTSFGFWQQPLQELHEVRSNDDIFLVFKQQENS